MPALCMGGVLGHPCEAEIQCCDHACLDDAGAGGDETDPCSHEGDCLSDPCRSFVVTIDGGQRCGARETIQVQLRIDGPLPFASADMPVVALARSPHPLQRGIPAPLAPPCHESDLPLLI
jgi:hypothetical protein